MSDYNFSFNVSLNSEDKLQKLPFGKVFLASDEKGRLIAQELECALAKINPLISESRFVRSLNYQKIDNSFPVKLVSGAFSYTIAIDDYSTNYNVYGNQLFNSGSLGAIFGINEILLREFISDSTPRCPKCRKFLTREGDLSSLEEIESGVLAVAFEINGEEFLTLTLNDIAEMYGINYFIFNKDMVLSDDERIVGKKYSELKGDLLGVIFTESFPLKEESKNRIQEKLKNIFELGHQKANLILFENRRAKGKLLKIIMDRPYCQECDVEIPVLSDSSLSESDITNKKSNLNQTWFLGDKNLFDLHQMTFAQLNSWNERRSSKFSSIYKTLYSFFEKVNLSKIPLKRSFADLSHGEKIFTSLALLLKMGLHDSVLFLKGGLSSFSLEDQETYLNAIHEIANEGNLCILVESNNEGFSFKKDSKIDVPFYQIETLKNIQEKDDVVTLSCGDFLKELKPSKLYVLKGDSKSGKTSFLKEIISSLEKDKSSEFKVKDFYNCDLSASSLAVAAGIAEIVAELFSNSADARLAGLQKKDFLINSSKFQCNFCSRNGEIEDSFDGKGICPACAGAGLRGSVSEIELNGHNIASVMQMSVLESRDFFAGNAKLYNKLSMLSALGLGDFMLKIPWGLLSLYDKSKVLLANELCKSYTRKVSTIFVLDDMLCGVLDPFEAISLLKTRLKKGDVFIVASNQNEVISQADLVFTPKCCRSTKEK